MSAAVEGLLVELEAKGNIVDGTAEKALDRMGDKAQEAEGQSKGLAQEQGRLSKASGSVSRALASQVAQLTAMAAGALSVVAAVRSVHRSIAIFADFESQMAAVEAVTRSTGAAMVEMTESARELGRTTRFSASEAAAGMQFLGRAGYDASEIVDAMPGLLDLAAAGMLDLGVAADITSNILSAFNRDASDSGEAADKLALAAASSNIDVQQLGDAMKYAGPIASALGQSLSQTIAAVGKLGDVGLGDIAGRGLRTTLSSLANLSTDAEKAIKSMGLTADQVNPQLHSMSEIFAALRDANLSATQAFTIFGNEGASVALSLAANAEALAQLTGELDDSEGAAAQMAATMNDTLRGSALELKSVMEGLAIDIGQELSPHLRDGAQAVREFLSDNRSAFVSFGQIAGEAIGMAVKIFETVIRYGPAAAEALALIAAGIAVLKFGPLLASVTALEAALTIAVFQKWISGAVGFSAAADVMTAAIARMTAAIYANPLLWTGVAIAAALLVANKAVTAWAEDSEAEMRRVIKSSEAVRESWEKTADAIQSASLAIVNARRYAVQDSLEAARTELDALTRELWVAIEQAEERRQSAAGPVGASGGAAISLGRNFEAEAASAAIDDLRQKVVGLEKEEASLVARQKELEVYWARSTPEAVAALTAELQELLEVARAAGLDEEISRISTMLAQLGQIGASSADSLGSAFEDLNQKVVSVREQIAIMKEFGISAELAADAVSVLLSENNTAGKKAIVAQLRELQKLRKEIDQIEAVDAFRDLRDEVEAGTDAMIALSDAYARADGSADGLIRQQEIQQRIAAAGVEFTAEQVEILADYIGSQIDAEAAVADLTKQMEFQVEAMEAANQAAQDAESFVSSIEEEIRHRQTLASIRREDFATEAAYQEVIARVNAARQLRIDLLRLENFFEAQRVAIMANGNIGEAERLRQLNALNAEYAEMADRLRDAAGAEVELSQSQDSTTTKFQDWQDALRLVAEELSGVDDGLSRIVESAADLLVAFENIAQEGGKVNAAIAGAQFAEALASSIGGENNYAAQGSAVGAVVGAIIGAWIGGFAAEGAAIGSAAGGALGSLINKGVDEFLGKVEATAYGNVSQMATKIEGSMGSVGNRFTDAISRGIEQALDFLGADLGSGLGIGVKVRDGVFYIFANGLEYRYESMQQAVDQAILSALRGTELTGISDEVRQALLYTTAQSFGALFEDLEFARMVERLPEMGAAASDAALAVDQATETYQAAVRKAIELGIETGKLDQDYARQLDSIRNSILGIQETTEERIRREAAGYNAQAKIVEAEARIQEADLLTRQAGLEAKRQQLVADGILQETEIKMIQDEIRLHGYVLNARGELLSGMAAVSHADLEIRRNYLREYAAITSALAAVQGVLANLPDLISEADIRAAIGRAGGARTVSVGPRFDIAAFVAGIEDAEAALAGVDDYLSTFRRSLEDIAEAAEEARKGGADHADVLRYIAANQRLAALDLIRDFVADMQISDLPALRQLRDFVENYGSGPGDMVSGPGVTLPPQVMESIQQTTGVDLSGLMGPELRQALEILSEDFPQVLQIIDDAIADLEASALADLESRISDLADANDRVSLDALSLAMDQLAQFGEIDPALLESLPQDIQDLLLALGDGAVEAADVVRQAIADMVAALDEDLQSLRDTAGGVGEFRISLRDLGTQFDDLRTRTSQVYAGTAELTSRLAELDRMQAQATRGLGIDFLGSLLSVSAETPRAAALQDQLRVAQLAMARATAIADAMALHAAGAFDLMGMSLAEWLSLIDEVFATAILSPQSTASGSSSHSSSYSSASSGADALAAALAAVADQTEAWLGSGLDPLQQTLDGLVDRFVDLRDQLLAAGGTVEDLAELEAALNFARQEAFDAVLDNVREFLAESERSDPGLRAPQQLDVLQSQFDAALANAMANPGQGSIQEVLDLAGQLQAFGGEWFTGAGLSGFLDTIDAQVAQLLGLELPDAEIPPPQDVNVIDAPTITAASQANADFNQGSMLALLEQNPILAAMLGVSAEQVTELSELLGISADQLVETIAMNPILGDILGGITDQIPLLLDAMDITGEQLVAILGQNPLLADILTAQDGALPLLGEQLLALLEQKPILGEQIAAMALAGDLTAAGLADLLSGVESQDPLLTDMINQMVATLNEAQAQTNALGNQDQTLVDLLTQATGQADLLALQTGLLEHQSPLLADIAGNTGISGGATESLQAAQLLAANATLSAIQGMASSQIANADGLISSMSSLESRVLGLTTAVSRLEDAVEENTNSQAAGGT